MHTVAGLPFAKFLPCTSAPGQVRRSTVGFTETFNGRLRPVVRPIDPVESGCLHRTVPHWLTTAVQGACLLADRITTLLICTFFPPWLARGLLLVMPTLASASNFSNFALLRSFLMVAGWFLCKLQCTLYTFFSFRCNSPNATDLMCLLCFLIKITRGK